MRAALLVLALAALPASAASDFSYTRKVGAGALCVPGTPLRGQVTALDAEFRARQGNIAELAALPSGRIVAFPITALEISATAIRERLQRGASVRHLVPDAVLDYIDSRQLYRTPHGH